MTEPLYVKKPVTVHSVSFKQPHITQHFEQKFKECHVMSYFRTVARGKLKLEVCFECPNFFQALQFESIHLLGLIFTSPITRQ